MRNVVVRERDVATFEWHYDIFELPRNAVRVLTNGFNPEQAYTLGAAHRLPGSHRDDPRHDREAALLPAWTSCRR
jgi:hypothetical protein